MSVQNIPEFNSNLKLKTSSHLFLRIDTCIRSEYALEYYLKLVL